MHTGLAPLRTSGNHSSPNNIRAGRLHQMDRGFSQITMTNFWKLSGILLALLSTPATALDNIDSLEPDLLEPDQAFEFSATVEDGSTLQASWKIADGYYMYRDRIRFSTDTPGIELGEPDLPAGKIKDDEFFGKIATFRNQVTASIPVIRSTDAPNVVHLKAVSQGCADIGVCYPPHTQLAQLDLPENPGTSTGIGTGTSNKLQALNALSDNLGLGADDEFLDPDVAFQAVIIAASPLLLQARWTIADEYYLYRDKLSIRLIDSDGISLGSVEIPPGETKHDEFFGEVLVFHHEIEAQIPLQRSSGEAADITLELGYQGCAEAGICYPPIKKQFPVALAAFDPDSITATPRADKPATTTPTDKAAVSISTTRQDDIVDVLRESSLVWVTLFFFAAGVLLAFTACMYPMIPILSSIIVGQGKALTTGRAFLLSLIYVEAVAVTYAVIGVVSAQVGAGVQAFFQNPWILGFFALVFVTLAMSMFGFFNMQLPASLQAKFSETSNRMKGGTLLGVA
ncbi:MAG: thiol:disulfide interchange protein, partial [Gammaproteobacteria bacterium]|nr:thiol:disulfide interchange protein [Gammaproteobacteria bacterium]